MKSRIITFLILFSFLSTGLKAQSGADTVTVPSSVRVFDYLSLYEPWMFTSNAASWTQLGLDNLSLVEAGYSYSDRGVRMSEEPGTVTTYNLLTKGMKKIRDISFFGEFSYLNEHYTDLMYNSTLRFDGWSPYSIGDTISGKQNMEEFDLRGIVGYALSDRWSAGVDVDYFCRLGAKQKDPRNLNKISSLTVTPSLIYSAGKWSFGASFSLYNFNEENSFSVQGNSDPTLFLFLGLGYFKTESNIYSYSNAFYGKGAGGGLQVVYRGDKLTSATEVSLTGKKEEMRSGSSFRIIDGVGYLQDLKISNNTVIEGASAIHSIVVNGSLKSVSGDEVTQDMIRITDGYVQYDSLVTLSWIENKQLDYGYEADFSYTYMKPGHDRLPELEIQAGTRWTSFSSDHYPVATYGSMYCSNIAFFGHIMKSLNIGSLLFSPALNAWYRINLTGELAYKTTPKSFPGLVERNFDTMTSSLAGAAISLRLEKPVAGNFIKSLYVIPAASYTASPDTEQEVPYNYYVSARAGITF